MRSIVLRFLPTLALLSGCVQEDAGSRASIDRAPIGKADQTGSCRGDDEDFCGGKSEGNCWCDDQCESFGDCCGDKALACEGDEFCADGEVEVEPIFVADDDGFSCIEEQLHCVTNDGFACPQLAPLPPDFCAEGEVVAGEPRYIASADGMECAMPSVHCVTRDGFACPQLSPLPPDFCAEGEVVKGPSSFLPSTDGMECELPSVHCVSTDSTACES